MNRQTFRKPLGKTCLTVLGRNSLSKSSGYGMFILVFGFLFFTIRSEPASRRFGHRENISQCLHSKNTKIYRNFLIDIDNRNRSCIVCYNKMGAIKQLIMSQGIH